MTAAVDKKDVAADAPPAAATDIAAGVSQAVAGKTMPTDPEAYRKLVRRTAIRVARENSWCDAGLSEYLNELGLPPKGEPIKVPVKVTATYTKVVEKTVMLAIPADDQAEAMEILAADDGERASLIREHLGRVNIGGEDIVIDSAEVVELDPEKLKVGDPDIITASRTRCEHYSNGWYCSRGRDHEGRHMAGDGMTIQWVGGARRRTGA